MNNFSKIVLSFSILLLLIFLLPYCLAGDYGKSWKARRAVIEAKHYCSKSCRLTEESKNCGQVRYRSNQYSNVTEICSHHLSQEFDSIKTCEQKCRNCKPSTMISKCTARKLIKKYEMCKKKPETGLCRAHFVNWYYDYNLHECKTFVYGGCGGNGNNFREPLDCYKRCGLCRFLGV